MRPDRGCPHVCSVRATGEYSGTAAAVGWDFAQGYLFRSANYDGSRATGVLKAAQMTASFQAYHRRAGLPPAHANTQYTMHSFRVGGAVSRSFAGKEVADIMPLVGWKSTGVAQRYIEATPPHHGEKKRESHEEANMDTDELPTLLEFAKLYAAFPRKDT